MREIHYIEVDRRYPRVKHTYRGYDAPERVIVERSNIGGVILIALLSAVVFFFIGASVSNPSLEYDESSERNERIFNEYLTSPPTAPNTRPQRKIKSEVTDQIASKSMPR